MINQKIINKFEKTFTKDTIEKLQDLSVVQDLDGSYHLFNKYRITKNNDLYCVKLYESTNGRSFNVLKNAVAWCTYDRRSLVQDSARILQLDNRLAGLEAEIQLHQQLVKRTKKTEEKLIYLAKLTEEKMEKRNITAQLTKDIKDSRGWQERRLASKS